ncbi:phosphoesterase [Paenibacillus spiritus]|uniref:Phosphoesterase n=1 Tax=Paenibacillus spiritus TaxID=2496557 RepID=A0A5J5GDX6_9BACL|nr:phosphoesterase [Paenibacillus spiritus]KAA9006375.1 phosphoesterase [Paenibacillus spiritus]
MADVFFTSDHHFGDRSILDVESRPFPGVPEMNEVMVARWNETVTPEDRVYHLGDFSVLDQEETRRVVSRLNGYKILILGNHDREHGRTRSWWLDAGFQEAHETGLIYQNFFLLTHEPLYMNKHMPFVNVHGHIHGQKYADKQHFNVCVEHWNYRPVSFGEMRRILAGEIK